MANTVRTYGGLKPLAYFNGTPWNGAVREYLVPSADGTALFVGDAVQPYTAGGTAGVVVNGRDCEGMPTCIQASATSILLGVVVGFLPDQDDLMQRHRLLSTNRIALVVDDPSVIFEIEEINSGTALTSTEVGLNTRLSVGAGHTTTGLSGMVLDNGQEVTTATEPLRIIGLVKRPDNNYGLGAKWMVTLNDHQFSAGTAGV
jgi:hypothetical protein